MSKMKYKDTVAMPTAEFVALRSMCAWRGCGATTTTNRLDPGWRVLMVYGDTPVKAVQGRPVIMVDEITDWDRDAVLCPDHAKLLDSYLVDLKR